MGLRVRVITLTVVEETRKDGGEARQVTSIIPAAPWEPKISMEEETQKDVGKAWQVTSITLSTPREPKIRMVEPLAAHTAMVVLPEDQAT